ncbi:MAG TPA: metallophosphoesterase [Actinobacteria bacterium]|nr:metallophosphoesterase [Actinomycetota bacterium]
MKLGIIADTHENMPMIAKAIKLFNDKKVDLVLHAGDFISPITAKEFKELKMKMIGIFGNNDGEKFYLREKFKNIGEIYEDYCELELDGKKVAMMHQPKFLDSLIAAAKYDLIIYGHTHEVDIRKGKPLVINPGECGGWLTGKSTVAIVDTKTMKAEIFELGEGF